MTSSTRVLKEAVVMSYSEGYTTGSPLLIVLQRARFVVLVVLGPGITTTGEQALKNDFNRMFSKNGKFMP